MGHSMEALIVPGVLPLFALRNKVLLPTAFARIQVSSKAQRSVGLLEHLSAFSGKDVLLAVVPALNTEVEDTEDDELRQVSLDKLSPIGVVARVLQFSRMVQTGDWVVVMEGICRISIDGLQSCSAPGAENTRDPPFDCVLVTQLELRPHGIPAVYHGGQAGSHHSGYHGSHHGSSQSGKGSSDPQMQQLGTQLKSTTRAFLKLLSKHAGLASTRRILELLEAVPAWRAADVVAAALGSTFDERLAVLQALDHKQRVKLALQLAQHALDSVKQSTGVPSGALSSALSTDRTASTNITRKGATSPASSSSSGQATPGEGDEEAEDDLDVLMSRLQRARPPPEVMKAAVKEYKRLRQSGENQPGYGAARAYLEVLAELPWNRTSADLAKEATAVEVAGSSALLPRSPVAVAGAVVPHAGGTPLSLKQARQVLDKQHYGLPKIKDRVVQYLAVLKLRGTSARAPILCFIGPPGVGKTSLARSVAEVLGRPFVRIALGGVRDEAEVRGHRRTYVGAMPGRIIQGLRRAAVADPVMLLDEVDKLGRDALRGDPASALLEVLDPEQNQHFTDTYLGLPFDLSRVTFVATANKASDIPLPLLDRLEVIQLSGYTLEEKVHIAQNHLLPKTLTEHGLSPASVSLSDGVMEFIADRYTREAGVRNLSRALAAICRHIAVDIVSAADEGGPLHQHPPSLDHPPDSSGPPLVNEQQHHSRHAAHAGASSPPLMNEPTTTSLAMSAQAPSTALSAPSYHLPQDDQLASSFPNIGRTPGSSGSSSTNTSSYYGSGDVQLTHAHGPASSTPGTLAPAVLSEGGRMASAASASSSSAGHKSRLFAWSGVARPSPAPRTQHGTPQPHSPLQATTPLVRYDHNPPALPYPPDLLATGPLHDEATVVSVELVEKVLGPPRYLGSEATERVSSPGAAAGLVWTAVGGSVQYIECARIAPGSPDKPGQLTMTGQVGEVLEESARIALSWIRAHALELGLMPPVARLMDLHLSPAAAAAAATSLLTPGSAAEQAAALQQLQQLMIQPAAGASAAAASSISPAMNWDVHVHLPAGAIPKDGPSAGITLAVALVSLLSGRCVRSDTAMTGELTLRGLVLPVGGIKEKLLAARHAGLSRVIVPARNMRDVEVDVTPAVRSHLQIIPAERLEDVLREAFDPPFLMLPMPKL
mmetsp:Transcript_6093/g.13222  ORF Transcript_6093/g.13222 Transcript_6093/m.13222 type:complete len:1166 (+) Transcript_6093:153-3650(+)